MEEKKTYPVIFRRSKENPILTSEEWPYPSHTVFNPGATFFKNEVLLFVRVEDYKGFSHLTKVTSKNGENQWQIDKAPTFQRDPHKYPEEKWGIEDPRITWMENLKKWAITYVSFSNEGPLVSIALTEDFIKFEKIGGVLPPDDKDAALFPKKFNGKYAMIHRPLSEDESVHMYISVSKDMKKWEDRKILLKARGGKWWDGQKIGLSAQPLETEEGWLILYHGVKNTWAGATYRLGLALLDIDNPEKVLKRSDEWIFGPEEIYEKIGDVSDVVFSCGWVHDKETDEIKMYYGGADSCICLATANLKELLEQLKDSDNI